LAVQGSIGWGIIGCGDVVDRKAGDSFGSIPGSRLVAVMRRSEDLAQAFAARFGASLATTDANEVLEHPDVDAIYVATPPENHLEYALAACAAGKACLVEKPAGRSETECRRMVEAFERAGLPLFVSYYRRHLPKFRKVKEIIDSGRLGGIVSVDYRVGKKPSREGNWRLDPRVSGGGQFYDLAGHVLDLFDSWFGPLELTGSSVHNAVPAHDVVDAVAITFRTAGGAAGSASWNFAATRSYDEIVIRGLRGELRLNGMSRSSPVRLELGDEGAIRLAESINERNRRMTRAALKLPFRSTYRFTDEKLPHRPMLEGIVRQLTDGSAARDSAEAALRTSRIMNQALDAYYGGRADAFWERPLSWRSLRARAARRSAEDRRPEYVLSDEERRFFDENGYLGPFRCDAAWQSIPVPVKKGRNLHLSEPEVFDVCTHPSVVRRIAQLMGSPRLSLFKSRFVVKLPGSKAEVAWHQDVGPTNGGYFPDGSPVPTISVWMAFDKVDAENGAVQILPGSHKDLIGDYHKRIRAELVEKGALPEDEIAKAVSLDLEPGEFYIFHSWLLHTSGPNTATRRRAGLNMRYAAQGHEYEEQWVYIPLLCADGPRPDLPSKASA
jgi:predicted dehydrogenase